MHVVNDPRDLIAALIVVLPLALLVTTLANGYLERLDIRRKAKKQSESLSLESAPRLITGVSTIPGKRRGTASCFMLSLAQGRGQMVDLDVPFDHPDVLAVLREALEGKRLRVSMAREPIGTRMIVGEYVTLQVLVH